MEALLQMDGGALLWIQEFIRQAWLDPIVSFYTKLGDAGIMWIVLCVALLIFPRTRRAGLAGAMALILSLICTNLILKNIFTRTRPWLVVEGLTALVAEHDPNSFPSGHTSASFAAATALWPTLGKKWARVTVMVLAALMALSRLYVGVHYPSDVLAGAAVGVFCGWAGCRLLHFLEERKGTDRANANFSRRPPH